MVFNEFGDLVVAKNKDGSFHRVIKFTEPAVYDSIKVVLSSLKDGTFSVVELNEFITDYKEMM